MSQARCKGKTKAGKPCRSRHVGEDGYCHRHSPACEEERALAKLEEERKTLGEQERQDRLSDKKDEQMKKLLLAEAHGYRRALAREYGLTPVLERMLADRIVLSYVRTLYADGLMGLEHDGATDHAHLELHRRVAMRESGEFLRNVRALKDLKTVPMRLIIKDAGQVNVGQQQVNVTDPKQVQQAKQATAEVRDAERSETKALDSTQAREEDQ